MKEIKKNSEMVSEEIDKQIKKFEKDAEYYPKRNLYFYYGNPRFDAGSIVITILSQKKPHIYCYASDIDDNRIKISFRNNLGSEDVSKIVKKGINGLKDATCGGHTKASASTIRKQDLEKFKENILAN